MNIDNPYISVYYYKQAEASTPHKVVLSDGSRPKVSVFFNFKYGVDGCEYIE